DPDPLSIANSERPRMIELSGGVNGYAVCSLPGLLHLDEDTLRQSILLPDEVKVVVPLGARTSPGCAVGKVIEHQLQRDHRLVVESFQS
ncbi:MAG: hypothetical protein KC668_25680, partial [Myxococcales bacterium]|nr:hypothetical protein [Myxococcales bacterium]